MTSLHSDGYAVDAAILSDLTQGACQDAMSSLDPVPSTSPSAFGIYLKSSHETFHESYEDLRGGLASRVGKYGYVCEQTGT